MSARRIRAIMVKDLRDAFRDGRILVLLLLPIGLAVFYNATAKAKNERPEVSVAVVDPGRTGLGAQLRKAAARSADVKLRSAPNPTVAIRLVTDNDASFAVIATGDGTTARARVLLPGDATPTDRSVVALVDNAVAATEGRSPPNRVTVAPLKIAAADREPTDVIDQGTTLVVISIILLLGFVALIVVPMQTAEEIGSGTFGALRLAATGTEILTAKAVCGLLYSGVGTVLTLLITSVEMHDPVRILGGALGIAVSLVGFGLLFGLVSGNPTQINTYGSFLVLPVVGLATAVLFVEPGAFSTVLDVLPFSQGARLLFDGVSPAEPFHTGVVPWLVVAAWGAAGFALLARIASRREA